MKPPTPATRAVSVLGMLALLASCGTSPSQTQASVVVEATGAGTLSVTTVTAAVPGPDSADSLPVHVSGPTADAAAWRAAAWQGATPAILIAGRVPHGPTVSFDVGATSGPPVQPVGDAMLAVAALAALRGTELRTDATLVADVAPNGGLFPVTGTAARRNPRATSGVTVLVPDGDLATVEQAYAALTHDEHVAPVASGDPPTDPELVELLVIATNQIIDQVEAAAAAQPATAEGRSRRRELLTAADAARMQLSADRPYSAYSTVTLAQQQAAMADAAAAVTDRLGRERRILARELTALQRRASDRMDLAASTPLDHVEQYPALADALTWASGTMGILDLAQRRLRVAASRAELATVAADLARSDYRLRTYLPLQVEAVQQVGQVRPEDAPQLLSVLAHFATLMGEAAAATRLPGSGSSAAADRAAAQLRVWRTMPRDDTEQATTVARLAAALSAYIASANSAMPQRNVDPGCSPARSTWRRSRTDRSPPPPRSWDSTRPSSNGVTSGDGPGRRRTPARWWTTALARPGSPTSGTRRCRVGS